MRAHAAAPATARVWALCAVGVRVARVGPAVLVLPAQPAALVASGVPAVPVVLAVLVAVVRPVVAAVVVRVRLRPAGTHRRPTLLSIPR